MYFIIDFLVFKKIYETLEEIFSETYYPIGTEFPRVYYSYSHQRVEDHLLEEAYHYHQKQRALFWAARIHRNTPYTFRKGPVPGISCNRYRGKWNRRPRTKQELSQEVPTRQKRKYLPTTRDDLWSRPQKSWKSQRKTQYK